MAEYSLIICDVEKWSSKELVKKYVREVYTGSGAYLTGNELVIKIKSNLGPDLAAESLREIANVLDVAGKMVFENHDLGNDEIEDEAEKFL